MYIYPDSLEEICYKNEIIYYGHFEYPDGTHCMRDINIKKLFSDDILMPYVIHETAYHCQKIFKKWINNSRIRNSGLFKIASLESDPNSLGMMTAYGFDHVGFLPSVDIHGIHSIGTILVTNILTSEIDKLLKYNRPRYPKFLIGCVTIFNPDNLNPPRIDVATIIQTEPFKRFHPDDCRACKEDIPLVKSKVKII
jgi:hypothetical protein